MSASNNTTVIIAAEAQWSFTIIGKISIAVISLILNLSMLIVFVCDRRRITAFTIYLVCLLTINVLFLSCWGPLNLLGEIYPTWWMGHFACAFLNYMNVVFSGCIFQTHCLITINRIWAMRFPVSYRNHHTKKVAVGICLGIVLFNHLISCAPYTIGLVQNWNATACRVYWEGNRIFATVLHFVINEFSLYFVAIGYLCLLVMFLRKRCRVRNEETPNTSGTFSADNRAVIRMSTVPIQPQPSIRVPVRGSARRKGSEAAKPFVVLTLSTVTIVVCWTPVMVNWLVWMFLDVSILPTGYYNVTMMIYSLQPALDPAWFAISLRSVQDFLRERFRCKREK